MTEKLLLVDASSSIFRAFYALPALANAAGVPTHATLGFTSMLLKVMRETEPDQVVVVWDAPGRKRRKELYAEYKATRDATPEDLGAQLPYIRRIVDAYALASLEYEGEEADDVIATLARKAEAAGLEVVIVSTDRDLMQLVSDRVSLLDTMRDRRIGPAEVEARYGVTPAQVLDFRALTGDSSDNIPGVAGIGEKGAANLLREYGSLDALLERAAEVKGKRPREALLAGADSARLSRELARLRDDLPLELDTERFRPGKPDATTLAALFRELELKRLLEEVEGEAEPPPRLELDVDVSAVATPAALEALAKRLADAPRLGLACVLEPEVAMRGELVGIALADRPDAAHYVDVRALGEDAALERLREAFERGARTWIGSDLKRDAVALARRGIELRGDLCEASLAAYVADPSQQVGRPEVLARAYLGLALPALEDLAGKGAKRRALTDLGADEVGRFFGTHAAVGLELLPRIEARLEQTGQRDLYRELEVPLVRVLARLELAGVRVDEAALQALAREIEGDLARLEARIYELAGEQFKINSPKQLQHILFEKLALPPSKRTKTGFSTDESVLEELALSHELPRELLEHRKLSKLQNTYVDSLPRLVHPETGRIHCQFNQKVAATGRLSTSSPNLQNIPVRTPLGLRIRETFIPAEGRLLLSADYSQIELRILAHCSEDPALVDAFRHGADIHVATASEVFGVRPEDVSEAQRSQTKAINFGIIYGSSAFGIARQLGISQGEAAAHIKAYFERYPGVRAFLDATIVRARDSGYAETLDGRRRYLPDLLSRNRVLRAAAERMATNSVLQGTAADIIKRAMVRLDADLQARGAPRAQAILQVHDELVFEVHPDDADALQAQVVARMQDVAELRVPLVVHVGRGANWREAH